MVKCDVAVVGAGIAGLTAAHHCAKNGYDVIVYERNKYVGFLTTAIFSTSLIDIEKLEKMIGFKLRNIFYPITEFPLVLPNSTITVKGGDKYRMYNVLRGKEEGSVDNFLLKKALDCNVKIELGKNVEDPSKINAKKIIIACGHESLLWDKLGIRYRFISGMGGAAGSSNDKCTACAIADRKSLPGGYAHVASLNGMESVLMGSFKREFSQRDWDVFEKFLLRKKIISTRIKPFCSRVGRMPIQTQLYSKQGHVLAGAISGCHDPVFNYGLVNSLVSGKIAALAIDEDVSEIFNKIYKNNRILEFCSSAWKLPYHDEIFNFIYRYIIDVNKLFKFCSPNI